MSPRLTVHPSEKVLAVAAIYRSLVEELDLVPDIPVTPGPPGLYTRKSSEMEITSVIDPRVMAALIDASVFIAMGTDTQDLGIMIKPPREDAHH
jgi:hypothetical protein